MPKDFAGEHFSGDYTLHSYTKADGSFDLEKYRQIQIAGNKAKLDKVWAIEENIAFLANYLTARIQPLTFGICHGTRRGLEQQWFRKYLSTCEVIGTEISDTWHQFPHTVQWDFNEVNPIWSQKADFIYSNAFDHTYNPEKCLNAWMDALRPQGVCILEHGSSHTPAAVSSLDPFGAQLSHMPYLIALWGKGKFAVREIIQAPRKNVGEQLNNFLIIHKF